MRNASLSPAQLVRQSGGMARRLAGTARLHKEPFEAERFERIAAEAEQRARILEDFARAQSVPGGRLEMRLIAEHEAAVREIERLQRQRRGATASSNGG